MKSADATASRALPLPPSAVSSTLAAHDHLQQRAATQTRSQAAAALGRPAPWMAFTARGKLLLESTTTLCMNGAPTAQLAVSELSAIDALCGGRQGDAVQSELRMQVN